MIVKMRGGPIGMIDFKLKCWITQNLYFNRFVSECYFRKGFEVIK